MRQVKIELWVGSFMLVGICSVLIMIFRVADVTRLGSGDVYILKAEFNNIGSLKIHAPVKVAGVAIGRVKSIDLNIESMLPVVSMEINVKYSQFSDTSSVQILTSGLIGEQYIGLFPGFMSGGEKMLSDGDFIEDTKAALVLEDLIGQIFYSVK
ncbi:phospholipid ABC transporter-binding protein [Candidatus Photodesmus blepharus]|uniref:Phospholipid ABC transporter-binding protein n=1 Tax=Candidatus Photodesmus blepharonis TaxID=1179155 RepID=A0A084CM39_9GAMM|nr:outer membrane lipid asymmetry maintenance protein MlaD [Candidatus Photodesmus blepharus]KEY90868.1 phospholipid ABC transporter-binding protein [Candidatus Photodesmus blepharus]